MDEVPILVERRDGYRVVTLNRPQHEKLYYSACAHIALVEQNKGNSNIKAKEFGNKACEGGEMLGCFLLGILEGKQGNKTTSLHFFKKACDGGRLEGCHYLGVFESQQGDKQKAKVHLSKACDGGYKPACNDLNSI